MSRIAIISDIHSNVPAMNAVLRDIEKKNIDYIYCLGDMIGKGPSPAEVIELCKDYCDITILGNWEDFLLQNDIDEDPIAYYRQNIPYHQLDYLNSLGYLIEFYLSGRLVRLFHAHSNNIYRRVYDNSNLEIHCEMFEPPVEFNTGFEQDSDIAFYGDVHYSFQINYNEDFYAAYFQRLQKEKEISYTQFLEQYAKQIERMKNKKLINVGSVGQPFDGVLATYAILEGKLHSKEKSDYQIEIVKIPYNNQEAARIALASTMYDKKEYAREILTGIFRGFE
ncbi:MAG: metallophosphoesterase family protein [Peptostreptococcaceae bacterium]|nr:metallophosphoesterase family protein [Peptostreptococcaceae bacterium]